MTKTVMSLPIPTTPLSQANSSSQEEKPSRIQGPQQRQVEDKHDQDDHQHHDTYDSQHHDMATSNPKERYDYHQPQQQQQP